jgi:hypothetical protein
MQATQAGHCSLSLKGAIKRDVAMSASEKPLRIDTPAKLAEVKMVFSISALMFEGDLPASLFHTVPAG